MRGRTGWWGVVLECPDAVALATFYSSILGWPVVRDEGDGAVIAKPDHDYYLSFDTTPDYVPPVWPAAAGSPRMMMHLDVEVDDLETAVADAIELGATPADFQPQSDVRVLLDPAGHPFCLYLDT